MTSRYNIIVLESMTKYLEEIMKKVLKGFAVAVSCAAIAFLFVFSVWLFFIIPSLDGYYAVFVFLGDILILTVELFAMYCLGKG